jgi:hypothetical protein
MTERRYGKFRIANDYLDRPGELESLFQSEGNCSSAACSTLPRFSR